MILRSFGVPRWGARLGRSLKTSSRTPSLCATPRVGLRSLKEAIDTDSSAGQLVFHIFGALAEFERALIREGTRAGLAAARAHGRVGGRRKRLDEQKRRHAVELYRSRQRTVMEICVLVGISRSTLYVEEFAEAGGEIALAPLGVDGP